MRRWIAMAVLCSGTLAFSACSGEEDHTGHNMDAAGDSPMDMGTDATSDGAMDGGMDSGMDSGMDTSMMDGDTKMMD